MQIACINLQYKIVSNILEAALIFDQEYNPPKIEARQGYLLLAFLNMMTIRWKK